MSTYSTDKAGFPIETCWRCAGNGTYPSSAWNGICLACDGQTVTYPKGKVAQLAMQWHNDHHVMTHVTPAVHYDYAEDGTATAWEPVRPGDQIRLHDEEWRTVAAVRRTAHVVGQTFIGLTPGRLAGITLETIITFADGSTVTSRGEQWRRRLDQDKATARRADLVAQAVKAYERLLKTRATNQAKATAKRAAEQAERETLVQALLEANPELLVLVGDKYADAHGFMADMRAAVLSGKPSDKQLAGAIAAVRRDAEREQERAALVATGVTCPTGRLTVEATVVWVGAYDSQWGVTYKLRIRSDEGWNAQGNAPRDLLRFAPPEFRSNLSDPLPLSDPVDWLKGRRVRVTATFAPSDKYQLSGKFSRPKVEVIEEPALA